MQVSRFILFLSISMLLIAIPTSTLGQTEYGKARLYKRVMIVNGSSKQSVNDDAHFITFNHKGFYVSDSQGNGIGESIVPFVQNSSGYHCYEGYICGMNAQAFFSSDYSRLNVKSGDMTYVYQCEPGNTTSATKRGASSNGSHSASYVPIPTFSNGGSGGNNHGSHREVCNICHGTGIGTNHIKYSHSYTASETKVWCSECGSYGWSHYHEKTRCGKCNGTGYIMVNN